MRGGRALRSARRGMDGYEEGLLTIILLDRTIIRGDERRRRLSRSVSEIPNQRGYHDETEGDEAVSHEIPKRCYLTICSAATVAAHHDARAAYHARPRPPSRWQTSLLLHPSHRPSVHLYSTRAKKN